VEIKGGKTMIKGLKIVLLGSVLACATASTMYACISESVQEPAIVAYAEETFQEKSYVYSHEDGVATLTLLNDIDCSIRLQIFSEEFDETIYATYTRDVNVVTIYLPEGEFTVEVNDETMTFGEYLPPEEPNVFENIWSEFEVWKETYLVPLLSGVSITSIVSLIATILLTIIREKRASKREANAVEKHNQAEALISQAYAVIGMVKDVFEHIKTQINQNEVLKQLVEEKLSELQKIISKNSREIMKINKIEPILKLLVQIEGKLAVANENAVASGILTDVNELVRLAKEL
jgi:hypothetical protein